jgi:hypothetical protein
MVWARLGLPEDGRPTDSHRAEAGWIIDGKEFVYWRGSIESWANTDPDPDGSHHRDLSQQMMKGLRDGEPTEMADHGLSGMTKVLPPVYFLAAIALTVAAHFLFPVAVFIPYAWRFVGLLPVAAGIALNIAADHQLKRFNTTVKPFERSNALITEGIFRWSRNPMYLGMVLIVGGIAVFEGGRRSVCDCCGPRGRARPCLHCG